MASDIDNFGKFIIQRRLALKLTQGQLARLSKTHQQHISLIEQGRIDPSLSTLSRILAAMSLTVAVESAVGGLSELRGRLDSFRKFNRWEVAEARELAPEKALELSWSLAQFYLQLHGPLTPEPWEVQAQAWRQWRERLSRCPA